MTRLAVVIGLLVLGAASPVAAQWQNDPTINNAYGQGIGGALMYACTPAGRAVVVAVIQGTAINGREAGELEVDGARIRMSWDCAAVDTGSACTARDASGRLRDSLIRGGRAMAVVGSDSKPRGVVIVSLRGSARAIARVRARCGR